MEWINYHHLLYFWVVAKEGSIAKACDQLYLAQPTISGQIRALEQRIGERLFERVGRRLNLTETGQVVYRYADEIFSLGQELMDVLKGRPTGSPVRFFVGICDSLPKFVTYRILEPALKLKEQVHLVCKEANAETLLEGLAAHELDLVLTDTPVTALAKVKAYSHLLGECDVTVFGTEKLAEEYRKGFPKSLDGAPWILPTENTSLRRSLDRWFEQEGIHPVIRGEFEDSALIKVFSMSSMGVMPCPTVSERDIKKMLDMRVIGRIPSIKERFYAITVERRLKNPAVLAICEAARDRLFG